MSWDATNPYESVSIRAYPCTPALHTVLRLPLAEATVANASVERKGQTTGRWQW
ncbi:MAG: hypothetical protein NZ699_02500 [Roseiflexus sp.]|nr:hypothetical protein [Roseiflexus sp.]MCS7287982.1 hypothetical protein [Roseiflexus sp.]MDW8234205.1 hypothetical protein [Roseiflexaceae bacterium]